MMQLLLLLLLNRKLTLVLLKRLRRNRPLMKRLPKVLQPSKPLTKQNSKPILPLLKRPPLLQPPQRVNGKPTMRPPKLPAIRKLPMMPRLNRLLPRMKQMSRKPEVRLPR